MLIDVTGGVDWYAAAANNMTFSGAGVPTISAADVFTYGIPWDSAIQGNLGFGYYGVGHTNTIYLYEYWFDEDGAYVARWSRSRSCLNGSWSAGASVIANAATRKYVIPVFYGTGYAAGEDVHVDELYLTLASSGGYEVPNPDWYTGAAWSTEQWVTSGTEEVTLAASWGLDADDPHIYSVWTNDGTADSVSKSVPLRVIPSAQDNPTLDAIGTITAKTKTVGWTVTTQTKHHLRIYRDVGLTDLEYDNGIVVTGTKSDTIPFNEEGSRWIWLTTWNDEGLASDVDTEAVTVDWADPPRPVVKPDSTVIELATSGNSTASLRGTGGTNEEQGQSFEATTTSTVTAIGVRSDIGLGTPTDTVTCTIYSDSNFTTALGVSDTRNAVDFDESTFLYHVFNFPVPVSVVSGTTYYVAFSRSDTYDASNYVGIRQNTANPYANGSAYTKNNGTWSITSGTDLWMMVFQSDPTPTTAGAMTVVVANPTPGAGEGGTAATSYNEIWRREWDDDTTAIRIDDDLAEDGTFTDWGPASGVQYQYKAVAWNTTNTTSNESDWTA